MKIGACRENFTKKLTGKSKILRLDPYLISQTSVYSEWIKEHGIQL